MPDQDMIDNQLLAEIVSLKQSLADLQQQIEVLRESEKKFEHLFCDSAVGMAIALPDGRFLQANQAFCDFVGYSVAELREITILSITHPDDRESTSQAIQQTFRSGPRIERFEKRYLHKSGRTVWGEVTNTLIRDAEGAPSYAIAQILDINERKKFLDALVEREARLLEAQEVADVGFHVLDIATGRWTSSPVLDRIFGISDEYERTIDGWANLIHPEDRPQIHEHFLQHVIGENRCCDREYRIVRHDDKEVRWVHGLARWRFDENDRPLCLLGTIQDITKRKLAELALQKAREELEQRVEERTAELSKANQSLEIFRRFAEASGEGFGMSDFEGHILYVNPTLCRLYGEESPADVYGKKTSEYYTPDYAQRRKEEMIPELLRSGYWQTEQTIVPRQGKSIQVLQGAFLIRDEKGNPFRIAGVISDITQIKQAEQSLQKSNDELRAIYDGMVDGLLIADIETKRFIQANAAICQMLGYTMEEMLSKSVMDIHPAKDLTAVLENFQALAEGQISIHENSPVLRKNGSIFYADIASNRIVRDHRKYLIGFFHDITEKKRAQEALQKEHRTLRHLLQSSDHERQTIAYEIHDGLAQYLAGSIMQFQAYQHFKDAKPDLAEKSFAAGMTMLKHGHFEARRLISGVRPPVLDEAGVVEAIAHLINEHNREKRPQIAFHSNVRFHRLVPILENAIYRICQEGLSNACKYSDSEKVLVGLRQRNDRIRIDIRDWGIGFNPKKAKEGSYGLIGIRERVRLLGGKFRIHSAAGKGTRLAVELPLMEREE